MRCSHHPIVDQDCQPEVKEHHKWNNDNNVGQEILDAFDLFWVNRFEDAPNKPDRRDRRKQWQEAEKGFRKRLQKRTRSCIR